MLKFKITIVRLFLRIFVKTVLLTGGWIEVREGEKYLVWKDTGYMTTPPRLHEMKLTY